MDLKTWTSTPYRSLPLNLNLERGYMPCRGRAWATQTRVWLTLVRQPFQLWLAVSGVFLLKSGRSFNFSDICLKIYQDIVRLNKYIKNIFFKVTRFKTISVADQVRSEARTGVCFVEQEVSTSYFQSCYFSPTWQILTLQTTCIFQNRQLNCLNSMKII